MTFNNFELKGVAVVSQAYSVPAISYAATSAALSSKATYPLFGRVVPSDALQSSVIAQVIRFYNFTQVSGEYFFEVIFSINHFILIINEAIGSNDVYGYNGIQGFVANATGEK